MLKDDGGAEVTAAGRVMVAVARVLALSVHHSGLKPTFSLIGNRPRIRPHARSRLSNLSIISLTSRLDLPPCRKCSLFILT
ncbi:unnamed protein product [Onchocerca flexuosa]|uniref:LysR family transcriptional regulator n=1 Tax=Onchocerca flexuosa TaxID=387005 RepID=A0A183HKJ4_9BILA|nr:unnamed protein product [Onchocerca flexuosa]